MATDSNCFYCTKSGKLDELMIEICPLKVSTLYLLKNQAYKGRCVVAYKEHKTEPFLMEGNDVELFYRDVANAAQAISKVFGPNKINYATFGDFVPHVHVHVVPKYEGGPCWGKAFDTDPVDAVFLTDAEYKERIELIKKNL